MIIYGKNTVKEAILAKRFVHIIYMEQSFKDASIENLIRKNNIKTKYLSKHDINLKANQGNHQGIVAEVEDYKLYPLDILFDDKEKKIIILDQLEDPHNFGAIIRTAEAAGVDAIIIKKRRQVPITSVVAKIASGALEYIPVIQVANLNQAITKLKENNFWIVGSTLDAKANFKDISKDRSIALIVGNEGFGMSPLLKKACDYLVKIPMEGTVNSLNVSVAAALLIYQMKALI